MKNLQVFCSKIDQIRPLNTVIQARIPIFLPLKCLSKSQSQEDIKIENSWGEAIIQKCRLTQAHRNLLDCIFAYSVIRYFDHSDTMLALFDIQDIQRKLGISPSNHNWIKRKLLDMKDTSIIIKTKKETIYTSIVLKFKYSKIPIPGTKSHYFYVLFDHDYIRFFCEDIWMCYKSLLKEIIQIKNPTVQALIRYMLSHTKHNIKLVSLLTNIKAISDSMSVRQKDRKIKDVFKFKKILEEKFKIYLFDHPKISEVTVSYDNKYLNNVVTINPDRIK
jgi:hypothetical protein